MDDLKDYQFDKVARSERYFTASLLTHLLMFNDFSGAKSLLGFFFADYEESDEIEIVSELDPLRDGSVINRDVKEKFKKMGRIAVPDLFIRIGKNILVLEAKFFSEPNITDLKNQMNLQIKAIEEVKSQTKYVDCNMLHCLLTINEINFKESKDFRTITWDKILEIINEANKVKTITNDFSYSLEKIKNAIIRAKNELQSPSRKTVICERYPSLKELLKDIQRLIDEGKIYFGFTGGENVLMKTKISLLNTRDHYKISDVRWTDNWLTLDLLIKRLIQEKISSESLDEIGDE